MKHIQHPQYIHKSKFLNFQNFCLENLFRVIPWFRFYFSRLQLSDLEPVHDLLHEAQPEPVSKIQTRPDIFEHF